MGLLDLIFGYLDLGSMLLVVTRRSNTLHKIRKRLRKNPPLWRPITLPPLIREDFNSLRTILKGRGRTNAKLGQNEGKSMPLAIHLEHP